ncbi:MAG: CAP domain-containing protein [Patescibacteria group bacterium]
MKRIRNFLHHVFVPGKHNNHQAHSISHLSLTAYLLLSILALSILPNLKYHDDNVLGFATDINSRALYDDTNAKRIENGLSPLRENSLLNQAARAKAEDMFAKGYWAHFGPSGETPWNFILGAGYDYEYAGENLAKNFLTSDSVVEAWMNSPTHRGNILNGNYKEVGYAVVNGTLNNEETTLVVQMFGRQTTDKENATVAGLNDLKTDVTKPTNLQEVKAQTPSEAPHATNSGKTVDVPKVNPDKPERIPQTIRTPTINLLPAYQFLSGILVAFLIIAFAVDLYHLSKTDYHRHRGKHIAHLIFLAAALIGIFMIGRGGIL